MDHFEYRTGELHAEAVALSHIAAAVGTPTYVYSRATLTRHYRAYEQALGDYPGMICYAVKANSNLAVLNVLARLGAGFDIVSEGELERVLAAGGRADRVVFSGVGKLEREIARALEVGVHCFNVESEPELTRIERVAQQMDKVARISVRVNPDVDAKTHPYISTGLKENKFGVTIERAFVLYRQAAASGHLEPVGIDCHIGSQLTELQPFMDALDRVLAMVRRLADEGIRLKHIDLGGGLGVRYREETPPQPGEYAEQLRQRLEGTGLELILEPGRSIAANAGVLLTRVEFLKQTEARQFAVVDAAMNDLIRPSLYSAWQEIIPVHPREGETTAYDIVGPVCETGDFLGKDRELALAPGDLLAVRSSGAYGFVMASNYNSRCRPAEIMVDGDTFHVVRERETLKSLFESEHCLPDSDESQESPRP